MVEWLEQLVIANSRNAETTGNESDWYLIASEMNNIVPPKTALEWKIVMSSLNHTTCEILKRSYSYLQHFDTMKLNVQNKVRAILEFGGSVEDNLSEDELKIYRMIPHLADSQNDEWSKEHEETVNDNEQRDTDVAGPSSFDLPIVFDLDLPVVLDSEVIVVTDKPHKVNGDPQSTNTISAPSIYHSRQESLDVALDEVSNIQNTKLIDLLQQYFLLTVGRSSKVNGVEIDETTWNVLVSELNALGPSMNAFDWKIVILSFKNTARNPY